MEELKTKEYKLRAQKNYLKKFENKAIRLPKGTTERIEKTGQSVNAFVVAATLKELDRLEQISEEDSAQDPDGCKVDFNF